MEMKRLSNSAQKSLLNTPVSEKPISEKSVIKIILEYGPNTVVVIDKEYCNYLGIGGGTLVSEQLPEEGILLRPIKEQNKN
jgi:hypothetical protein